MAIKSLALVLLIAATCNATTFFECPEGFTNFLAKCYYQTPEVAKAKDRDFTCTAVHPDAYPATITSDAETLFLEGFLTSSAILGYTDVEQEGSFKDTFGNDMTYTNWHEGEPNNVRNEDCLVAKDNHGYKWNDIKCSKSFTTLCEVPAKPYDYYCDNSEKFDDSTCFKVAETSGDFDQAIGICQNLNMTLASIRSDAEKIFTSSMLQKGGTWIGLNDRDLEGSFAWTDGSPVDYVNWGAIEPNDSGADGHHEDCVETNGYYTDYKWNDIECSLTRQVLCRGPTYVAQVVPAGGLPM